MPFRNRPSARAKENSTVQAREAVPLQLESTMQTDQHSTRPAARTGCQPPYAHAMQVDLVFSVNATDAGEAGLGVVLDVKVRVRL